MTLWSELSIAIARRSFRMSNSVKRSPLQNKFITIRSSINRNDNKESMFSFTFFIHLASVRFVLFFRFDCSARISPMNDCWNILMETCFSLQFNAFFFSFFLLFDRFLIHQKLSSIEKCTLFSSCHSFWLIFCYFFLQKLSSFIILMSRAITSEMEKKNHLSLKSMQSFFFKFCCFVFPLIMWKCIFACLSETKVKLIYRFHWKWRKRNKCERVRNFDWWIIFKSFNNRRTRNVRQMRHARAKEMNGEKKKQSFIIRTQWLCIEFICLSQNNVRTLYCGQMIFNNFNRFALRLTFIFFQLDNCTKDGNERWKTRVSDEAASRLCMANDDSPDRIISNLLRVCVSSSSAFHCFVEWKLLIVELSNIGQVSIRVHTIMYRWNSDFILASS